MSIQLVVFPQTYDGQHSVITSGASNQMIADGQLFMTANGATIVQLVFDFPSLAIALTTPGSWYRVKTTGVTAPSASGGVLTLNDITTSDGSYVAQTVVLTPGVSYDLQATTQNTGTGKIRFSVYDGVVFVADQYTLANVAGPTNILTFTPNTTNATIFVTYEQVTVNDSIEIVSVTLNETGLSPSGNIDNLTDGQVILDLYEDEDIPLTLSVDDFKNAAEKVQSYSKAFKLPATKRNNQIFDNVFEITRADDGVVFNPYKKTQALLKQDGFTLFEGYLRLIEITEKDEEKSYNINLYSEAIALADVLKDLTFNQMDLSELNGLYTPANIKDSWNGLWNLVQPLGPASFAGNYLDMTTNVIKFPFVDWAHNYTVDGSGFPVLPNCGTTFRPWIKIKYLVDRIFNQYLAPGVPFPFRITSNFFESADFGNLYMDFNWGDAQTPRVFNSTFSLTIQNDIGVGTSSFGTIDFATFNSFFNTNMLAGMPTTVTYASGVLEPTTNNQTFTITYTMNFDNVLLFQDSQPEFQWVHTEASGNINIIDNWVGVNSQNTQTYAGSFTMVMNLGDTLKCQVRLAPTSTSVGQIDNANTTFFYFDQSVIVNTTALQTTTDGLLKSLRGELGQWDFLKGIMTMFNLVAIPDKSDKNNIIIEPYADVFVDNPAGVSLQDRAILHDWTEKVDVSQIKFKPLTELDKQTIFKFVEEDDDYAFNVYKQSVGGHLYGSKVFDASGFTLLTGTKEIVAEPFAATFVKPLMAQYPDFITPSIYSYNTGDGVSEPFDNAPRICYNNGIKTLGGYTYDFPATGGGSGFPTEDTYLQFSHLNPLPGNIGGTDFHFGECQFASGVGSPPTNNLYNTYWSPYFNELYNPNTRVMSLKVNLNAGDISKFNMYDKVMIKNRVYRVNKINYKPGDLSAVEFILVN